MAALTPQDISHFRERLEAERHAIESRIAVRNRDIQENVQEESGVGDSGDESLRIYDREDETDANAALLCVFNTYLAIAVLVLLQLNSVIVPRIGPLNRF